MTSSTTSSYRIKGHWLLLARGVWIILAITTVVIFIAGLKGINTFWHQPCNILTQEYKAYCVASEQAINQLGLPKEFYSIYNPLGMMVETIPWILVGVLIFWKKSDEPFGLLFSLMLVVAGTFNLDQVPGNGAKYIYPVLLPLISGMNFIGLLLLILWYRFPDGRFVPHWLRWVAVGWAIINAISQFFPDSALNYGNWPSPWPSGIAILFVISLIYSLV